MGGYTQLTQEEQYQIYILKKAGYNQTEIADMLKIREPAFDLYRLQIQSYLTIRTMAKLIVGRPQRGR